MIDKEVLLTEKRRYEQPLFISKREEKLLKKDYPVQNNWISNYAKCSYWH